MLPKFEACLPALCVRAGANECRSRLETDFASRRQACWSETARQHPFFMKHCPSCGGIIGRDCFNPDECAYISMQQENERQQRNQTTEQMVEHLFTVVQSLEERVKTLESMLIP